MKSWQRRPEWPPLNLASARIAVWSTFTFLGHCCCAACYLGDIVVEAMSGIVPAAEKAMVSMGTSSS